MTRDQEGEQLTSAGIAPTSQKSGTRWLVRNRCKYRIWNQGWDEKKNDQAQATASWDVEHAANGKSSLGPRRAFTARS